MPEEDKLEITTLSMNALSSNDAFEGEALMDILETLTSCR
ncbi:hypothetical protein HDC91_001137 [Mucilaginibacter sp. AK015]|nr:hypothetical protein [Mucilaginibacter sp. AK015]